LDIFYLSGTLELVERNQMRYSELFKLWSSCWRWVICITFNYLLNRSIILVLISWVSFQILDRIAAYQSSKSYRSNYNKNNQTAQLHDSHIILE